MTQQHPELETEQAYVDFAYHCLELTRSSAWKLRDLNEASMGGTMQARFERNAFDEALVKRLNDLDLGDAALVFGRIDRFVTDGDSGGDPSGTDRAHAGLLDAPSTDGPVTEAFHIGRLAVADEHSEPVVVDWRAPVAEPFYRATGRDPMGLVRRRHFAVEGRTVLGLEDELFGAGHLGVGHDDGLSDNGRRDDGDGRPAIRGYSTLLAALERGRTGTLGDIVATIQAEQDEIIRSPQQGVLVVQGGPGTGKTVVALHRAAYLLYTHRFPLEDQGVLVIGPNRVFLRYIERVLPSLGEAGVEQVVLADLVPNVEFARPGTGPVESPEARRVKGDARMSDVIDHAVRDRQRPLTKELVVPYGTGYLRLTTEESARIVKSAARRVRRHNAGRRHVEHDVFAALAASSRNSELTGAEVRQELRVVPEVRAALDRMWPVLTPAQLLHDLFGSRALLRLAGRGTLTDSEIDALFRPRADDVTAVLWSSSDIALLDDAREVLGPVPGRGGRIDDADEIRTYGHIVVDEVQDLSPMQLKMVTRRSLNGSVTVVGDLAQATGPWAPSSWDDVTAHLPDKRPSRVVGLSVGYRIPAQIMQLADRVMAEATPDLRPPRAIREGDALPRVVRARPQRAADNADRFDLGSAVAVATADLLREDGEMSIAVIVPDALATEMSEALDAAGIEHGRAATSGLDDQVTVVPISVAKGLEIDAVVVVEPARIASSELQGLRALYVALTRPTQRLTIVHGEPLPAALEAGVIAVRSADAPAPAPAG
jgi:DNA helicase IV